MVLEGNRPVHVVDSDDENPMLKLHEKIREQQINSAILLKKLKRGVQTGLATKKNIKIDFARIKEDVPVTQDQLEDVTADVEIEVFPELFKLESLRDTIHDATRAKDFGAESSNIWKYKMFCKMRNLAQEVFDKLKRGELDKALDTCSCTKL